jgi:spore maturation protein CgeB
MREVPEQLRVEHRSLFGETYSKAINSFDINLCFLRRANRDRQTTRTFEIPACGSFMLAERTDEHVQLFDEGQEAEFFGSTDELFEKVRFYLTHEDIRQKIAQRGRQRCLRFGYDYRSRMRKMLEQVAAACGG